MENKNKTVAENFHRFDLLQLLDIIGEDFSDENIFFETDPSFAFPSSDVGAVDISDPRKATIRLPMMNLLGITTPLPIGLSDYAGRDRKGSEPLQAFLSIMQNRIHHLWIDALRKYKIWRGAEAPAMRIFEKLSARPLEQFEEYDPFWLSAFSSSTRSADSLKRIIQSIWKNTTVRVVENIGRWTAVENRRPLGGGVRLSGSAAVIGSKVFDLTAKFRVSIGPADIDTYKSLLPDLSGSRLLKNILSLYINEPLICELEVSCRRRNLDLARLGENHANQKIGGLGRTITLGRQGDEDDTIHSYRTVIFEKFAETG